MIIQGMAQPAKNKGTIVRVRGLLRAGLGRVIRRGFFRIMLILFLLAVVLPFVALQALGNQSTGNRLMHEVVSIVFDPVHAEVTWDEDLTEFKGPSITLTGSITYHNLRIRRRTGATPHPRGEPLDYEFLYVPKVEIEYDLKRLPDLPITTVRLEDGLVLHFNIHKGTWIDNDLFRATDGVGGTPTLPQIITQGECSVRLRADGILEPPEHLANNEWYDMKVTELGLLPNPAKESEFVITGNLSSDRFGKFVLGGTIERKAQHVDVLFRTAQPIAFNRDYAAVLDVAVRDTVEQFQITATATVEGKLEIEPGSDLQFSAKVAAYDGSICFIGFPLAVGDVSADINVRDNNITVDAIGRRGGANVRVYAQVDAIGSSNEILRVDVDVRNLLVDEKFRLALLPARLQPENIRDWDTGMPYTEEDWDPLEHVTWDDRREKWNDGFPDWKGPPPWRGGSLYPSIDDVLPFICRAFTPIGLADFQLRLNQEMKGRDPVTGKSRLDADMHWKVFIHDATAAYVGLPEAPGASFPIPINGAYGVVEGITSPAVPGRYIVRGYTNEELVMLGLDTSRNFVAHENRGLTGTLNAESERLWVYAIYDEPRTPGGQAVLRLEFQSEGVDFTEDMKSRLPENIREVIAPFAPTGRVDIQRASVIVRPTGDEDVQYDFTLTARNIAAQYHFPNAPQPARFREVSGTIRIDGATNRVELSNLSGRLLGSPVTVNLTFRDGGVPTFKVESDEFQLRDDFTDILPADLGSVLKRFEPRGYVQFEVTGNRDSGVPDFTSVDVRFIAGSGDRAGSVTFDGFPYVVTNVTGRLFVSVTEQWAEVIIHEFSGRGSELPGQPDQSRITINGQVLVPIGDDTEAESPDAIPDDSAVELDDAPAIFDLRIEATRVPVDDNLMAGFTRMFQEPGETETPALVEFVEMLRMTGTIGTSGRLVSDANGELDWQFEIMLEDAGVNFVNFPYPITGMHGSVIVDRTDVSLRNVEGEVEQGKMTLHNASYSEEDGWSLTVSARNLSFHASPTLRAALPEGLRSVLNKLNPRGEFDVDLELAGKDDLMRYQLSLDIFETDMDLGLHFDKMTARFDMEGVFENDSSRQNGTLYIKEVFFKDARFNDVTTAVQYFGDRVEFPNLRGSFYDGWLEGRFGIDGEDYSGEIEIRGANLKKLGETAFPTAGELLGALDAEILFHSQADRNGQIGRGRVDVQPYDRSSIDPERNTAKLLAVPLFSQIAAVTGSEANFDEGHVYFWLGHDRIIIREMDFVSNAARVETFGGDDENYIMYDTALMRMKLFFTLAPRSPIPLPLIQDVLDLLKQILFPLFVTGTLNSPEVLPFSLSAEDLDEDEFPRRPRGQ